tara:strand:+ start:91 stop:279 length:189 start_codon:yes stop_codon:yes gene_type:complete
MPSEPIEPAVDSHGESRRKAAYHAIINGSLGDDDIQVDRDTDLEDVDGGCWVTVRVWVYSDN